MIFGLYTDLEADVPPPGSEFNIPYVLFYPETQTKKSVPDVVQLSYKLCQLYKFIGDIVITMHGNSFCVSNCYADLNP